MARYNNHVKKTTVDFPGGIPLCQFNFQVPQVLLSSNERLTGASDPQRRGMFHHFLCTTRRWNGWVVFTIVYMLASLTWNMALHAGGKSEGTCQTMIEMHH